MSTTSDAVRAFATWLAREYPEIQREHMAVAADAYLASVKASWTTDARDCAAQRDPWTSCRFKDGHAGRHQQAESGVEWDDDTDEVPHV